MALTVLDIAAIQEILYPNTFAWAVDANPSDNDVRTAACRALGDMVILSDAEVTQVRQTPLPYSARLQSYSVALRYYNMLEHVTRPPVTAQEHLNKGQRQMDEGHFTEAMVSLRTALGLFKTNRDTDNIKATQILMGKNYTKLAEAASNTDPVIKKNWFIAAKNAFDEAFIESDPQNLRLTARIRLYKTLTTATEFKDLAGEFVLLGHREWAGRCYEEQGDLLARVYRASPNNTAMQSEAVNAYQTALTHYYASNITVRAVGVEVRLAEIYSLGRQHEDAAHRYEQASILFRSLNQMANALEMNAHAARERILIPRSTTSEIESNLITLQLVQDVGKRQTLLAATARDLDYTSRAAAQAQVLVALAQDIQAYPPNPPTAQRPSLETVQSLLALSQKAAYEKFLQSLGLEPPAGVTLAQWPGLLRKLDAALAMAPGVAPQISADLQALQEEMARDAVDPGRGFDVVSDPNDVIRRVVLCRIGASEVLRNQPFASILTTHQEAVLAGKSREVGLLRDVARSRPERDTIERLRDLKEK